MKRAAIDSEEANYSAALSRLASEHAVRIGTPDRVDRVRRNIAPHIDASFRRCNVTKTLLNRHHPVSVRKIHATQLFGYKGREVDHVEAANIVRNECNNAIFTGTGGTGKSIFVKYLWMSLFEKSDGRIPIFIELRNLNSMDVVDLEIYLLNTLSQGIAPLTDREFKSYLSHGDVFVLLDGFDEIVDSKRESVQAQILALATSYPSLKIVVSSRPDDRFASWASFHIMDVRKMRQRDVIELISRSEFDSVPKARFLKQVKSDAFFEKHASFLSNPLLTSMMLLTFTYNFDVPNKMHLFYEQAFDALFQRHDTHKAGGFKREFKSALSEDIFQRILSYFCMITYASAKVEFSKIELVQFIEKAISIEKVKCKSSDFMHDLVECVCLVVQDGLTYAFAHRSFQEYFAAYCLARVNQRSYRKIVTTWGRRTGDQTVVLLKDMNPEIFRELYVLPVADDHAELLKFPRTTGVFDLLKVIESNLYFVKAAKEYISVVAPSPDASSEFAMFFYNVLRANNDYSPGEMFSRRSKDGEMIELIEQKLASKFTSMSVGCRGDGPSLTFFSMDKYHRNDEDEAEILNRVGSSAISKRVIAMHKSLAAIVGKARRERAYEYEALSEALDLR
jgi:hypothetical protein